MANYAQKGGETMPIKWSAVKVSEAMDMAEEFIREADLPLFQAKIVATEARKIDNLPQYMTERLYRLIDQIERIDNVKGAITSVRKSIPDGAIEAERESPKYGSQQALV